MSKRKIIIAIDGYSSCGKSTMAKQLAAMIGYIYVDTGAMYRAVTWYCLEHNLLRDNMLDEDQLARDMPAIQIEFFRHSDESLRTMLNGKDVEKEIRGMLVSKHVSRVSSIKFVREAMVAMQQTMGMQKGIVMDGRDIGTVVFPQAELKIFVTADAKVRAQRRYDELSAKGERVDFDEILKNIEERDYLDATRKESPLRKAADALVLDNGNLSIDQQNKWLMDQYNRAVCEM
jgi:CMP/dCMP kinase